jgi:hypothetical protein
MLKRHKNRLLGAFNGSPFIVDDFDANESCDANGVPMFIITYKGSRFKFVVRTSMQSHHDFQFAYTMLAPQYPLSEFQPMDEWVGIDVICDVLGWWLKNNLKEYTEDLNIADLWTDLANGLSSSSVSDLEEDDISEFTIEEKRQIRVAIDHFRDRLITEFAPTRERLETVDKRLKYLADALDRLNRFDWKGVLISTMLGISTALSLDTEKGKALLGIAKAVFSKVIGLLGY